MQRHGRMTISLAIAMSMSSCDEIDRGGAEGDTSETIGPQTSEDGRGTTTDPDDTTTTTTTTKGDTIDDPSAADTARPESTDTSDSSDSEGTSTSGSESVGTSEDDGEAPPFGTLPFEESFEGLDGAPWPAPWAAAGTAVVSATLDHGRGRLTGATGQVARMVLPGFTESDVDVSITVQFDDWTQQGFGLYVRQNGGALQETEPPGQGYATYVEGGFMQSIGIWRETNGVEELLAAADVPGGALEAGVPYRLRVQCLQQGASTYLRTRIWPEDEPEPEAWQVELVDDTAVLQGAMGSFALDVYNYEGNGSVLVDDMRADPL
jgi:hypothetical protein